MTPGTPNLNNYSLATALANLNPRYGESLVAPAEPVWGFGVGQSLNLGDSSQFDDALAAMAQREEAAAGGGGGLAGILGSFGNGSTGLLGLGKLGLSGIGAFGGLMQSRKMLDLAQDQFKHTRDVANTNLTNQIQSYNTALTDRARTRAVMEGRDQASADKYIEENKLRR